MIVSMDHLKNPLIFLQMYSNSMRLFFNSYNFFFFIVKRNIDPVQSNWFEEVGPT